MSRGINSGEYEPDAIAHGITYAICHRTAHAIALGALLLGALLASGCGSGPSARATRVHEDARLAERMISTRPGVAARRFVAAGDGINSLATLHPSHPLTVALQEGDQIGGMPRAVFEARLAVGRRVMGRADLLDAAVSLLPAPRRGLGRLAARGGPRPADRLRAAFEARGRPIPPAVAAHGAPPAVASPAPPTLPDAIPDDARALDARWQAVRGHADADEWLAAVITRDRLPSSQRFVWARALHRGRGWQALAARLLADGDVDGAERTLGFAVERGLLEGLAAPLRTNGWLPAHLVRTLRDAGAIDRAERLMALYAAGLARVFATPGNGIDDLAEKAETLAALASEMGDPVALGWLGQVLRRDLLDGLRQRARQPVADDAVRAAHRRLNTLDVAERAEPALAPVRRMAPALAAAVGDADDRTIERARAAADGLPPADRIVLWLALARLERGAADAHLGAALDAIAELADPGARVDALIDVEAVRLAIDQSPGPRLRAGLARLLFGAAR